MRERLYLLEKFGGIRRVNGRGVKQKGKEEGCNLRKREQGGKRSGGSGQRTRPQFPVRGGNSGTLWYGKINWKKKDK